MSRAAPIILAAALGGVVVGAIVWFARPAPPPQVAPVTAQTQEAAPAAPANTGQPPPWAANGNTSVGADLGPAIGPARGDPKKRAAREAIRAKILALTANGRQPTPAEMNVVLSELERVEGSSVISGVNVGALRNNLVKVDEMQKLGEQMKNESSKPGGGDPQKIKDIMARLQKLQSEVRLDISAPNPAGQQPPVVTQK